jgi:hypothetical protein
MKVRMRVGIPGQGVEPGDVVDVSPHEAESWLLNGSAEEPDAVEEVLEEEDLEEEVVEEEVEDDGDEDDEDEDFFAVG